jgi:hypothetical protein
MIAGTEQVATEEPSLPRMSDGEDNDDLYDSDAPSEESERDEDSPQGSRVDISWLTNSDPAASTSSAIASLVPTSKKQAARRLLAPFPCIWLVLLRAQSAGSRSRPMAVVKVGQ